MSDLHEQAEERKRSDTSLINFMHNHKVSVRLIAPNWVATTEYHMGMGKNIRSALANLERSMYGRS
jgi:adenine C2-methylase RlmN of 23S rRNA A2503 and tRNA A37